MDMPAESLDDETLIEWIAGALCVAEVAEERRDWALYRTAMAELDALLKELKRRCSMMRLASIIPNEP